MLISWLGSLHSGTLGLQDSLIGGKEGMLLNPFTEKVRGAEGEVRASPISAHPSFNQIPCKFPAGRQQSKKPCAALQPTQKTPLPPCRGSISPLGGQDQKKWNLLLPFVPFVLGTYRSVAVTFLFPQSISLLQFASLTYAFARIIYTKAFYDLAFYESSEAPFQSPTISLNTYCTTPSQPQLGSSPSQSASSTSGARLVLPHAGWKGSFSKGLLPNLSW